MEKAFTKDMAVIKEDGSAEYIDNPQNTAAVAQSDESEQNINNNAQLEFSQDNDDFASIMEG